VNRHFSLPSLLATASGSATPGSATIDPTTAQAMAAVGQAFGGPDDLYQALVGLVGSQTSEANNNQTRPKRCRLDPPRSCRACRCRHQSGDSQHALAQQAYQATAAVINSTTTALEALLAAGVR